MATGHFPCISLRWLTKIPNRTHSNIQMANTDMAKMADQLRNSILYSDNHGGMTVQNCFRDTAFITAEATYFLMEIFTLVGEKLVDSN